MYCNPPQPPPPPFAAFQSTTHPDYWAYLEVVVHPGAHKLPEGIVRPLSDPAVDGHALGPEANGLRLEFTLLQGEERKGEGHMELEKCRRCWRENSKVSVAVWRSPRRP